MNCPKCSSSSYRKSGKVKDRQRYTCKECGYNYSVVKKSPANATPMALRKQALQLYLEGLVFHSIGRMLGVGHVSVFNWIKGFGKEVQQLSKYGSKADFVELDEMQSYIDSKKTTAGYSLLLIDIGENPCRSLLATEGPEKQKDHGKE